MLNYLDDNDFGKDQVLSPCSIVQGSTPVRDYTYRPSKYRTLGLSDEEYEQYDRYAADLYRNVKSADLDNEQFHARDLRGDQVRAQLRDADGTGDTAIMTRMRPYLDGLGSSDLADFDSQIRMRSGYMLSLLAIDADRFWEKNDYFYMEFHFRGSVPVDGIHISEIEYDSEDEEIPTHPEVCRYRVVQRHMLTFFSYYSGGLRDGISNVVKKALFDQVYVPFDLYSWLGAVRADWKKINGYTSGQTKIFLSSLRAFDNLPPGRISVLVIGSASHPVKSGYSYPGLARFLTLSGFSGEFHMFDPLESHVDCEVGNFKLFYFRQKYVLGGYYKIFDQDPTVILDDMYTAEGTILAEIDLHNTVVLHHPSSIVCMKWRADLCGRKGARDYIAKNSDTKCVPWDVAEQFAYDGNELRIYYRAKVGTRHNVGQWVGNNQCAQCWHYAGLINRIGSPQDDLRPYWLILHSMSGHHCTPLPGIRNVMLLNALRHEISRGVNVEEAKSNIVEHSEHSMNVTMTMLDRLQDFAVGVEDEFLANENHYVPNFDMNMTIRDRVSPITVADVLADQPVLFRLIRGKDYSKPKFEHVLELYIQYAVNSPVVYEIVLVSSLKQFLHVDLILVEDLTDSVIEGYEVLYQLVNTVILVRSTAHETIRQYLYRGRDYINLEGYLDA